MELTTGIDDSGRRLDRILRRALPELPLSALHRLLRQGRILVDGQKAGSGERIRPGARISLPEMPGLRPPAAAEPGREAPGNGEPDAPPLPPIIAEGSGLLILNKPAGLDVHGPGSLDSLVRAYLEGRGPRSLSFRSGPLHRLDKPSSGLIVFSTSLEGARNFSALLRENRVKKFYLALAEGRIDGPELWRDELVRDRALKKTLTPEPGGAGPGGEGPKTALTGVVPLAQTPNHTHTLLLAELKTGRTHQIRAQAALHGHPLAGDRKYGARSSGPGGGFLLHAWKLDLDEGTPLFPALPRRITAPPPGAFCRRIGELFGACLLENLTCELRRSPL